MEIQGTTITTTKRCEKCGVTIPENYVNALCDSCYSKLEEENKRLGKKCEMCGVDIPSTFVNLLCWDCYKKVEENNKKEKESSALPVIKEEPVVLYGETKSEEITVPVTSISTSTGVNISASYDWIERDLKRFRDIGVLIPNTQREVYEKIRNFWVRGRTVIDVGCSIGVGSNILSHGARHVWGIDVNETSIQFASQFLARPNLSFGVLDIERAVSRELAHFEVVVCIEVFEHLVDLDTYFHNLKSFFSDRLQTVGFITIPNINKDDVRDRDIKNPLHIQHMTPGEFYGLLTKHFKHVTMYSSNLLNTWSQEETIDSNGVSDLIVAKVEGIL